MQSITAIPISPAVLVLVGAGTTVAITSGFIISTMIGEVNRKLPEDQQISYLWGYPGKVSGIREKYKRFYPQGKLSTILTLLQAALIVIFGACAVLTYLTTRHS